MIPIGKRYNTPHRSHVVKTRMTEEEYADFTERLKNYDMSQAEFIRQAITRATIRPVVTVSPVNDELLSAIGKLIAEYGKIGGNLNQIARALNEYGTPYNTLSVEVRAAISDLAALKFEVLRKVGDAVGNIQAYLTALLQSYTPQSAQAELDRIFNLQYKLTVTEEIEVRYRTEQRTGSYTDAEGNTHTYTYTVEVPYNYYILNVTLTNRPISSFVSELLTPEQLEMYRVYLQTSGNKPLVFGGGSADTSASEDLSGVTFVNGTRPGNTVLVDIAKSQVGNVGGAPYWSWYGFNSRVAWCACFVSWCYGQAGLSEPRFAGCQSQGVPWFTSHGQWGARGYENIAPGDAIFFDWDLDGSADHVGIVIGTDGSRVYTVEGNSGDACKIKSYPLDYACIKGYGLMNWN